MTDRFADQPAQPDRGAWQLPDPPERYSPPPEPYPAPDSAAGGPEQPPAGQSAPYPAAQPEPYPAGRTEPYPAGPPTGQFPVYNPSNYPPAGVNPTGSNPVGTNPTSSIPPGSSPAGSNPAGGFTRPYPPPPFSGYSPPATSAPPINPTYGAAPATSSGQPPFGQPSYGQPSFGQSSYGQSGWSPPPAAPKSRSGRVVLVAAITAAIVGGGIGAGVAALVSNHTGTNGLAFNNAPAPQSPKVDGSISAAAARIQPSVVTINVTGSQESGTGSGVIIRSDGYILTNNHVVSVAGNGGSMSVVTNDGQQAKATLIGADEPDDLAVVKVSGLTNLKAATFGSSSNLVTGQTVVAVGAPLGLSDTVTSGIVSNIARPVVSGDNDDAVFDAVQTDAAINPGNSGGPLVDLNGNVIGINAAIATANSGGVQLPGQSTQSGSIGIGFAIPADEANRIAGQLVSTGKATHAVIGVEVMQSTSSTTSTGATLSSVTAKSPAADAGILAGDVVTKVGNQLIPDGTSLIAAIRSRAPGDTVSITINRKGVIKTVQVKLGTSSN
jgi:putative serine protease PepD